MLKKAVATILIIIISVLCLPVFSSAATVYSSLPEPVPTFDNPYYVLSKPSTGSSWLVSISIPGLTQGDLESSVSYFLDISSSYSVFYIMCTQDLGLTAYRTIYNAVNGSFFYKDSFSLSVGLNSIPLTGFSFSEYSTYLNIGCPVMGSNSSVSLATFSWSDETNPSTYTNWLSGIQNKLDEIDSNTDDIEHKLSDIKSELALFNSTFNSYKSEQHSDLTNIYNKLDEIYRLMNQEETTRAPAIEEESEVEEFFSNEAALNKDFSSDLNQQFNVAGNVFDGNSAFSFISNLFEGIILSVPSFNSLLIFSLAIGLCVLILGRRLNA